MCGFIGYSSPNFSQTQSNELLKSGINSLEHRGPDFEGFWTNNDNSLGLAHSRLSIIDLNNRANQPMISDGYILAFNGEIYNFIELKHELESIGVDFETSSDTEVILHGYKKWKSKVFKKLRGMFAIVIFDISNNEIILARDHSGQKPLYYLLDKENHAFIFASEIKGISFYKNFNRKISLLSLNRLFSVGFCEEPLSIFNQINKVEAGKYYTYKIHSQEIFKSEFWDLDDFIKKDNKKSLSEESLLLKLEELLLESIDLQFRSDVPVGMLLSGGVDSSLLVALASKIKGDLNTYTVRFSKHDKFDESIHARLIADKFKTNHFELEASSVDPSIFDELIYFYDEPIFDTSVVPTFLLSKLISNYCKVAIGGDGGDELFGGYPHYNKLLKIKNKSQYVPYVVRNFFAQKAINFLPLGMRGTKTVEFFGNDYKVNYPNTSEFFSDSEQSKLFKFNIISQIGNSENNLYKPKIYEDFIDTATLHDFKNFLREDILVKVDRASMANSLEIRSPFLDHKLIEFVFENIPSKLKVNKNSRKILLKKLASRHLPKEFDFQRKQGFSLPLSELVRSESWKEYFCSKIDESDPKIFNHKYAHRLLQSQSSFYNNAERMSAIIFFMIWVEKFKPVFD